MPWTKPIAFNCLCSVHLDIDSAELLDLGIMILQNTGQPLDVHFILVFALQQIGDVFGDGLDFVFSHLDLVAVGLGFLTIGSQQITRNMSECNLEVTVGANLGLHPITTVGFFTRDVHKTVPIGVPEPTFDFEFYFFSTWIVHIWSLTFGHFVKYFYEFNFKVKTRLLMLGHSFNPDVIHFELDYTFRGAKPTLKNGITSPVISGRHL